jgi:hypothetical protein
VDVGGQVLFLVGFGLIILALTWGGATYPWYSAAIIVSLVFGFIFIGVFVCWERLMVPGSFLAEKLPRQRPMIPWDILSHRDIGLLFYSEITSGMAMHAVSVPSVSCLRNSSNSSPGSILLQHLFHRREGLHCRQGGSATSILHARNCW